MRYFPLPWKVATLCCFLESTFAKIVHYGTQKALVVTFSHGPASRRSRQHFFFEKAFEMCFTDTISLLFLTIQICRDNTGLPKDQVAIKSFFEDIYATLAKANFAVFDFYTTNFL